MMFESIGRWVPFCILVIGGVALGCSPDRVRCDRICAESDVDDPVDTPDSVFDQSVTDARPPMPEDSGLVDTNDFDAQPADALSADLGARDSGGPTDADSGLARVCLAERCNGDDDDCDGAIDEGDACEIVDLAVDFGEVCAVLGGGSIKCWGPRSRSDGFTSPIGDEPHEIGHGMPAVPFDLRAVRVAVLSASRCAVFEDGQVGCWGLNHSGELGLESHEHAGLGLVPLPERSAQVVMATQGGCARSVTGAVRCWGGSVEPHTLGVATDEDIGSAVGQISRLAPLQLGRRAVELASGHSHICALLEDGSVKCWGDNSAGQLGFDGIESGLIAADVPSVDLALPATHIFAAGQSTCARLEDGVMRCWGEVPARYVSGRRITDVAMSGSLGCAIFLGGVECWNSDPNTNHMHSFFPTGRLDLGSDLTPVKVGVGNAFACALFDNGRAKCWGNNQAAALALGEGRLSVGARTDWAELAHVDLQMGAVSDLAAGGRHTCALNSAAQVKCWGSNRSGLLGLGDQRTRGDDPGEMGAALPFVQVPVALGDAISSLSLSAFGSCALSVQGAVFCWGSGELSAIELNLGGARAIALSVDNSISCVLLEDGQVRCWGSNRYGSAGLGHRESQPEPTESVPLDQSAVQVATGDSHACALLDSGQVKCWGANANGQLGQGDTRSRGGDPGDIENLEPIDLPAPAIRIFAGAANTCALLEDETVRCWGDRWGHPDIGGVPGEMGEDLPIVDFGGRVPDRLSLARTGYCAVLAGEVMCSIRGPSLIRSHRPGDPVLRTVARGIEHACALDVDGNVACWGANRFGQIGLGLHSALGDDPGEMGDALPFLDLGGP